MEKRYFVSLFIVLSLVSLFFVPFVYATEQTLGGVDGYPPGTNVNLVQTCSNCTFVNITSIVLAGGSLLSVKSSMEKDEVFYNYTLDSQNTRSTGEYIVNWAADPDGILTTGNYNFFIKKGGISLTTGEAILYVLLMVVISLACFLFLFFAFNIPYSDDRSKDGTL